MLAGFKVELAMPASGHARLAVLTAAVKYIGYRCNKESKLGGLGAWIDRGVLDRH